jgi:hypothetical protein
MGATVVLHKSQTGTVPFLQERGLSPLKRSRSQNIGRWKRGASPQWPSDPATRRISGAATCDSSLR